jgi:hypothetical protein
VKETITKALDLVVGDTWPKRRRIIYFALIFLAEVIAICLWAAVQTGDTMLIKSVSDNAFWLGGAIIGSYVFGSIWDDSNKRKHMPKAEPPAEEGE